MPQKGVDCSVISGIPFQVVRSDLTLSLPTNCITGAVSSRDHSPEKAEQTKISARGTLHGTTESM